MKKVVALLGVVWVCNVHSAGGCGFSKDNIGKALRAIGGNNRETALDAANVIRVWAETDGVVMETLAASLPENRPVNMKALSFHADVDWQTGHYVSVGDAAAIALSKVGGRAKDVLLSTLRTEPDVKTQARAIRALGALGDESVAEDILPYLRSQDREVRVAAIRAVGELRYAKSVGELEHAIATDDWDLRVTVVFALGRINDDAARDALRKAVLDSHPDVRSAAAESLARQLDVHCLPLLQELLKRRGDDASWVARALVRLDGGFEDEMLRDMASDDVERRRLAVFAVGGSRDPKVVSALVGATRDKDWKVRRNAVDSLGEFGSPASVTALADRLRHDAEHAVRWRAAEQLGKVGDETGLDALVAALSEESNFIEDTARESLFALTGKDFGYNKRKWREWIREVSP